MASDKVPLQPLDCPEITPTHFREGSGIELRASGSRQLDFELYKEKLNLVATKVEEGGTLYVVDLRQESHVFFNHRAVSWYADMDWANVGQSERWIRRDEANQIATVLQPDTDTVTDFLRGSEKKSAGQIVPTGYSELHGYVGYIGGGDIEENAVAPCRQVYPHPGDRSLQAEHCGSGAVCCSVQEIL